MQADILSVRGCSRMMAENDVATVRDLKHCPEMIVGVCVTAREAQKSNSCRIVASSP